MTAYRHVPCLEAPKLQKAHGHRTIFGNMLRCGRTEHWQHVVLPYIALWRHRTICGHTLCGGGTEQHVTIRYVVEAASVECCEDGTELGSHALLGHLRCEHKGITVEALQHKPATTVVATSGDRQLWRLGE